MASAVRDTAEEVIGFKKKKHRDWFDENKAEICELVARKNRAHDALQNNPTSTTLRETFTELRKCVQRELRRMENDWWVSLAGEIQGYADENDTHSFYNAVKSAYGPITCTTAPVRSADGATLHKDLDGITCRWAEHFSTLLNGGLAPEYEFIDNIPQREVKRELETLPNIREVEDCINTMKNRKSPGADGLPAEVYKYGGAQIVQILHESICAVWSSEETP